MSNGRVDFNVPGNVFNDPRGGIPGGFQDPRVNMGGPGNPRGIYNTPRGGQRQELGRYRPPQMNADGSWQDEGGYSYNLPNSFGPSYEVGEFRRPLFRGPQRFGFDPQLLEQIGRAGENYGQLPPWFSPRYGQTGAEFPQQQHQATSSRRPPGPGFRPPAEFVGEGTSRYDPSIFYRDRGPLSYDIGQGPPQGFIGSRPQFQAATALSADEFQQPIGGLTSLLGLAPRPTFSRRFPGWEYGYTQPIYDPGY